MITDLILGADTSLEEAAAIALQEQEKASAPEPETTVTTNDRKPSIEFDDGKWIDYVTFPAVHIQLGSSYRFCAKLLL